MMRTIEKEMAKNLSELNIKFILVGSIPEGTRLHSATELDIMMLCDKLEDCPLLLTDGDPYTLRVPENNHPM